MKIHAHTLANGMLVLIREVHSAPVATSWIWYRVGSRNEPTGQTGISHWVEHMLFKGTPAVPRGELDRLIARNGGTFNGFTWVDYTAYYETLPADRIELALRLEADRMVNALFEPDEVESERTVIIAELEGAANYPETWLDEAVKASAFTAHPYHNPVIGYKSDLLAMTRDELYTYYQTFYMPKNAVLVIVGDVDTDTILRQAETHFGSLPSGPSLPSVRAVEPEPQGERRLVIRRPGPAEYVQIGFLAPDCRHPDFAATVVLDAVLSGAKAPSFMGGGAPTNRSARIYQGLVETELAAAAWSSFMPTRDPYLFELSAIVSEAHSAKEVEAALLHELVKIQQDGITPNELARVLKQMRAQIAYSLESVTNQALQIGMWEVLDSYQRGETLLEELATVEAADVQRVAQTYLTSKRSVIGTFLPTTEEQ
ncbi:M16 family metallopeptidase [Candidatus Chloroploca asiatica]|uniref:Peptidase M16 n=1 Tax=Candidatus Chloroploca asiatica TaxID=1506545 RepID=A0A2H3KR69_9CHLR|nr:pitrilysin family protein [Candidatus Chloroploca asiatica]PDV97691.1 peptidase M16 [Candidatus Chloroploca asiatica]